MGIRSHRTLLIALALALIITGCLPFDGIGVSAGHPVDAPETPTETETEPPPTEPKPEPQPLNPTPPATETPPEDPPRPSETKGRLAIVMDDLGAGQAGSDELLAYPLPLTFAVLPNTHLAEETAATIQANGHTLLLHLPMEPINVADNNPGADAIYLTMSDEEITAQTARQLDRLPNVQGVNNHMGSAATADPRVMAAVLAEVQRRNLFFLDSRTTAESVVAEEAERIGLPYAVNDLFLDLERTVPAVKDMIRTAMQRAEANGTYIAIAHPHPSVAEAMYEMIPEFERAGIELVPVTDLLRHPAD